jgi:hypothetical protein
VTNRTVCTCVLLPIETVSNYSPSSKILISHGATLSPKKKGRKERDLNRSFQQLITTPYCFRHLRYGYHMPKFSLFQPFSQAQNSIRTVLCILYYKQALSGVKVEIGASLLKLAKQRYVSCRHTVATLWRPHQCAHGRRYIGRHGSQYSLGHAQLSVAYMEILRTFGPAHSRRCCSDWYKHPILQIFFDDTTTVSRQFCH